MADAKLTLFDIGQRGVNINSTPQDSDVLELINAKNAEILRSSGVGGLDQRPGMTRINSTAMSGGDIVLASDYSSDLDSDFTRYLYAGYYSGSTHKWRRSSDGTTWADVDTPEFVWSNNTNIGGYWLRWPEVTTVNRKFYFFDGNTRIGLHEFDGVTDNIVTYLPNTVTGTVLGAPPAPVITVGGESNPLATPSGVNIVDQIGRTLPLPTPDPPILVSSDGGTTYSITYKIWAHPETGPYYSGTSTGLVVQTGGGPVVLRMPSYSAGVAVHFHVIRSSSTAGSGAPYVGNIGGVPRSGENVTDSDVLILGDGVTSVVGAPSSSNFTYKIVAIGTHGAISAASSGNSCYNGTLSGSQYNVITTTSATGVATYDIYRTSGGSTQGKIGSVAAGGSLNDTGLTGNGATPPASPVPSSGTTYTYKVVAVSSDGSYGPASAAGSTTSGYSALSSTDYTIVTPVSPPLSNTVRYDVYRTVGGGTTGKIGVINIAAGIFTTGNGSGLGTGNVFTDGGLTGDASAAPTVASGTVATSPIGVFDTTTDGSNILVSSFDKATADPTPSARILAYNPIGNSWDQIGPSFPPGNGNGAGTAITMFGGSVCFGTYTGITSGNTSYITSTGVPLWVGGIQEVHATAASITVCDIVPFNGSLYVATCSQVAATAGQILKRAPGAVWTSVRSGPATAQYNAYTSITVFNGYLIAGWTSGGGATAARIESSPDGITWTNETTLATTDVVCQTVEFLGDLYVVLGKTGVGYNTTSKILKRTKGGVWSTADDPSDSLAGCIGIVYVRN